MKAYLDPMRHVAEHGAPKADHTGARPVFGWQMRLGLAADFPLLTPKKPHLKSIIYELLCSCGAAPISAATSRKTMCASGTNEPRVDPCPQQA
jgi:thymidylate synthase